MRKFLLALGSILLQACVSVLPEAAPPSARYEVTDVSFANFDHAPVAWTLGIDEPGATLAFDTAKIAISSEPSRIEYFAGGQWVDRAPRLFGVALLRSFENAGVIKGVGNKVTLPASTYVLQTDIRRLTILEEGERTADVAIFVRLTNGRSKVYASRLFEATEPVGDDTPGAAAKALNSGLGSVQRDIVLWAIEAAGAASKN